MARNILFFSFILFELRCSYIETVCPFYDTEALLWWIMEIFDLCCCLLKPIAFLYMFLSLCPFLYLFNSTHKSVAFWFMWFYFLIFKIQNLEINFFIFFSFAEFFGIWHCSLLLNILTDVIGNPEVFTISFSVPSGFWLQYLISEDEEY